MRKYASALRYIYTLAAFAAMVMVFQACGETLLGPLHDRDSELLGGETTVFDESGLAFNYPASNLSAERSRNFYTGNSFFRQNWVSAPSSTEGRDGLGPLFNSRSCSGCHLMDGRGRPPLPGEHFTSMLIRLSVPGSDIHGGPLPEPAYGNQLQELSVAGVPAEGSATVSYQDLPGQYPDGTSYVLQQPLYQISGLAYGAASPSLMMSPRVAPQMIGLGLLEAIRHEDLLDIEDPEDKDNDGISGRINYVWDQHSQQALAGRFGWKANVATLYEQVAGAFLGDIGITSSLFPEENCGELQPDCQQAATGGMPEISDTLLSRVVFYSSLLAVPSRRNSADPTVREGEKIFYQIGCTACHTPRFVTGQHLDIPELSNQTIRPFTDLLLHDMGAELADDRPDYQASGSEWRTPPLWGIGLFQRVSGHTRYLHDGRARNLEEALLWHGGEAASTRDRYKALTKEDREALILFLNSL